MRIFLIGYMGSGKTNLGEKLARKLGFQFLDTDQLIEKQTGRSITSIFQDEGESYFRLLEKDIIKAFSNTQHIVVSTGGGFPCFHNNMSEINKLGLTIYLKISSIELAKRLRTAKHQRPLIREQSPEALETFIRQHLQIRNEYYQKAKMIVVGKEQRINLLYNSIIEEYPEALNLRDSEQSNRLQ